MKWFYNLKVSAKLLTSFILIAAICGVVGYIGIADIRTMNALDTQLYQNMLVPVAELGDLTTNFQMVRVESRDMIYDPTQAQTEDAIKKIADFRAKMNELGLAFEKTIVNNNNMKAAYQEFLNTRVNYGKYLDEMIVLAKANKKAEALVLLNSKGAADAVAIEQAAIDKLISLKQSEAKALSDSNSATANSGVQTMLIAIAIAVVATIGLGFLISQIISRPINKMVEAAQKLAIGDVNVNIQSDTTDEIGILAGAFGTMIENIKGQVAAAEGLAAGNLTVGVEVKSEADVLSKSINNIAATLKALVAEAGMLTEAAVGGRLATRGDADKFKGGYKEIVEGVNNCLDSVIGPLNVAAEYVDRISKGDNPPKITDNYNGDFNEIKNNLNNCIEAIDNQANAAERIGLGDLSVMVNVRSEKDVLSKGLVNVISVLGGLQKELQRLTEASKEGLLSERGKPEQFEGAYADVVSGVNDMLDAILLPIGEGNRILRLIRGGNLREKVNIDCKGDHLAMKDAINGVHTWLTDLIVYVTKVANGDLTATMDKASADDQIFDWLMLLKNNITALVTDADMLAKAAVEGKLATRADATKHGGDYRKIVEGVNNCLDSVIGPLNVAAEYVDRISKGDIPPKISDAYNGDFNEIKNNLNNCIDNITALVTDAGMLEKAAVEGKLATRADASKHGGDYKKIVDGVNNCLDAVIGPLNVAAEYVDRISKGDIPPKISDTYNGDFNEIKNNLNNCVDNINALVADANILEKAAVEGKLATRADASKHGGDYRKIVDGVNNCLDSVIGPLNVAAEYVDRISKGDIPPKISDTYNGDFNEIKNNLNDCIDNINALVNDSDLLVTAAVEGKLDTRADAAKHTGDYRKIVEGVNKTLDAVIKPVKEASAVLQQMAKGNLKVKVTGDYKGDHAEIKDALNFTASTISGYITQISENLTEMSNGNLNVGIKEEYLGDFGEIKDSINKIIDSFNEVLGDMNNASDEVAAGSRQVSDSSQALSQGSAEQASSIEELTASMTEIADQTKQNALNANQANDLAMAAKTNAEKGNEQMKEMLKSMDEINQSSNNISKIIKVVDEIAFQTNILALNAAVEAARAGQLGKGFAVVADEVRNLAARSANAAKETATMIEGSIRKVEDGTKIANETAQALNQIVVGITESAKLVGDIAVASNEQATGIVQVNQGIGQVQQVTQTNSATAEQSAAASEELSSQAEHLQNMVAKFKLRNTGSRKGKAKKDRVVDSEMEDRQDEVKRNINLAKAEAAVSKNISKARISLSDMEFGKY